MINTPIFGEWMIIQMIVMFISLLVLGKAQTKRIQLILLGSCFHGALSVALFGLWSQFIRPYL